MIITVYPVTITITLETEQEALGFNHLIQCDSTKSCNFEKERIATAKLLCDAIYKSGIRLPV